MFRIASSRQSYSGTNFCKTRLLARFSHHTAILRIRYTDLTCFIVEIDRWYFSKSRTIFLTVIWSHHYRHFSVSEPPSCLVVSIIGMCSGKGDEKRNKQQHSCTSVSSYTKHQVYRLNIASNWQRLMLLNYNIWWWKLANKHKHCVVKCETRYMI